MLRRPGPSVMPSTMVKPYFPLRVARECFPFRKWWNFSISLFVLGFHHPLVYKEPTKCCGYVLMSPIYNPFLIRNKEYCQWSWVVKTYSCKVMAGCHQSFILPLAGDPYIDLTKTCVKQKKLTGTCGCFPKIGGKPENHQNRCFYFMENPIVQMGYT